jgi:hypothetical protein
LWQKGRDHPELTDPAMRTACLLDARDPLHELGDRLDHRGRRWRHVECRTSSRQSLLNRQQVGFGDGGFSHMQGAPVALIESGGHPARH